MGGDNVLKVCPSKQWSLLYLLPSIVFDVSSFVAINSVEGATRLLMSIPQEIWSPFSDQSIGNRDDWSKQATFLQNFISELDIKYLKNSILLLLLLLFWAFQGGRMSQHFLFSVQTFMTYFNRFPFKGPSSGTGSCLIPFKYQIFCRKILGDIPSSISPKNWIAWWLNRDQYYKPNLAVKQLP